MRVVLFIPATLMRWQMTFYRVLVYLAISMKLSTTHELLLNSRVSTYALMGLSISCT